MRSSETTRRLAVWSALAATILSSTSIAQRSGAKALEQKLADKLAQEWVANAEWITDLDRAKAEAKRRGKQILGYFTRSYAP